MKQREYTFFVSFSLHAVAIVVALSPFYGNSP